MRVKLFCLPYAGGSAMVYAKWRRNLLDSIELYPVELKGRGKRCNEPFYLDLQDAVEDVYLQVKDFLNESPYAFFGHSMGGIILYELAHKLKELQYPDPVNLFFSGRRPPHIKDEDKIIHNLPDDEFKKEILEMGGTPPEVFENKELLEIFLPILRQDHRVVETYQYIAKKNKLNCNFTIFYGKEEDITINQIVEWRQHTTKECQIFPLSGDHFFINNHTEAITNIIKSMLIEKAGPKYA